MADGQERAGLGRPAQIAIGFAIVALLTSLVAVVVVIRRGGNAVASVAPKSVAPGERVIDASEITKLKRDVVDKVTDDKGTVIGVKLKDDALRTALGLEPGDVITAINGRAIKREFDVYDAVLGMSMMDASIVYVEVSRDKAPMLMRWKLEGDLRSARRDPIRRPSIGGGLGTNPFTAPSDPLVDTIIKIDPLHFEMPRSTLERFLANPDPYARQARIVPSYQHGQSNGFKLYAIAAGSIWSTFGLQNGDTIRSINGNELSSPDKALELYTKVKDATELRVMIGRRSGSEETLVITIK